MRALVINADDYGYGRSYDEGIVEAARAGAIDGASAMVLRDGLDPDPLAATGIAIGLHLELDRAGLEAQIEAFEAAFGGEPDYLDGHHHCHASGPPAVEVADLARERGWPVRSVDARHRRLLRCKGVATADALVGRMRETEPVLPADIRSVLRDESSWDGVLEWVVHPGRGARDGRSSYDAGREEDLRALLDLADNPRLREIRSDWREIAA
jgi:predicted glycoside hydrolase/deacetylase ChbG (UPF0249 family)